MNKWDASSENGPRKGLRRATAAVDSEHRREFVDRIQRRARELQERAGAATPAGDQGTNTKA
jgi:hypothetical protein